MDRSRLEDFLRDPGVTLRWGRGETTGYSAVEVRHRALRWYRWSHELGRPLDEIRQTREAYAAEGPAMDTPPRVLSAIADALAKTEP